MMNRHSHILKQTKTAHRETLKKHLQHRLEAARNQGNDQLIKQLEAEARYLNF
ncbi:MAG: hypothetical protein HC799_13155 [Limnothrix sp. RL_2_0]|nr:hypothetical protein [Limnothrix sp. RL_2_0]